MDVVAALGGSTVVVVGNAETVVNVSEAQARSLAVENRRSHNGHWIESPRPVAVGALVVLALDPAQLLERVAAVVGQRPDEVALGRLVDDHGAMAATRRSLSSAQPEWWSHRARSGGVWHVARSALAEQIYTHKKM